jgi:hypothetical protein
MRREPLMRGLVVAFVAAGAVGIVVPAAQGSPEHPLLYVGGEKHKGGTKEPIVGWGTIKLTNRTLGFIECVNLVYGDDVNETEPGSNPATERAYGEILEWTGTSFSNSSGAELSGRCKTGNGLEAWAAVEPELEKTLTHVMISTEGRETERLAIRQVRREIPSVPWRGEARGTEISGTIFNWVRTGIALTERTEVEAQEASVGIPTERRTGCYPQPPLTEIVHEPGFTTQRESELQVKRAPVGCIRVDIVAPELGIETPFQGTLEPEATNGAKNGLTPSKGEFKGGFVGGPTEIPSERSSEKNEYYLQSAFGPGYTKTILAIKELGFLHEELLTIK